MSEAALLHNALVCLPTGLGKTLIAAALMYNFYRWFPRGRIVFTAPTRENSVWRLSFRKSVIGSLACHLVFSQSSRF